MFSQSLPRAAIVATLCLAGLASAVRESGDANAAIISGSSSTTSARARDTNVIRPDEKVMVPCAGHITQCGVEDKAKIIYVPRSTKTITNEIVSTSVVTHYLPGEPVEVTVDLLIVTTEEIQPTTDTVKWITSKVTESAIEQCFLQSYTILGRGPGIDGDTTFAAEAASTRSNDGVSPAASTPAASDESRPADDPAQRPLDTDEERPVVIGADGDISE
ncbi:hypothetical protein LB503_012675 [Fusarium chuoi]|nr:hypothetical protein LB503_012675 [Fusarium chuoi]